MSITAFINPFFSILNGIVLCVVIYWIIAKKLGPAIQAAYLNMHASKRVREQELEKLHIHYQKKQQQVEQTEKHTHVLQKSLDIWQAAHALNESQTEKDVRAYHILLQAQADARMKQIATIALQKTIFTEALHHAQQELKLEYADKNAIARYQAKLIEQLTSKGHDDYT